MGFVSAKLMTLRQAISIIMGDNCENIAHAVIDGHKLKALIED